MNKRYMSRLTVGLVIFSLAARKDPIEGTWKVKADPEQGGKSFEDVLTFKAMKMKATGLAKKGWPEAEYEDDLRQGGVAQFTCTLKNAKAGEEMKWQASITATDMRGTIVWTRKDKSEEHYDFTGTKN